MLTNLTHSFLSQNSPFLGSEVIKKITRTNCPAAHNTLVITILQASRQTSRTNSICPCFIFNRKPDIGSIIEALIALYDALGSDKGMDVLRVVCDLLCQ